MGNILVSGGRVTGIVDWRDAGHSIKESEYVKVKLPTNETSWEEALNFIVRAEPGRSEHWDHVVNEMMAYSGI